MPSTFSHGSGWVKKFSKSHVSESQEVSKYHGSGRVILMQPVPTQPPRVDLTHEQPFVFFLARILCAVRTGLRF